MAKIATTMVFIQSSDELFSNWFQVEKFLAEAANAKGMELRNVAVEGSPFRILEMTKKTLIEIPKPPEGKPVDPKVILNQMRNAPLTTQAKNFNQGKFLPSKGYLKKE